MAELVGERLHLGRLVHVHADRDLAGEEVSQAVGATDRRSPLSRRLLLFLIVWSSLFFCSE